MLSSAQYVAKYLARLITPPFDAEYDAGLLDRNSRLLTLSYID